MQAPSDKTFNVGTTRGEQSYLKLSKHEIFGDEDDMSQPKIRSTAQMRELMPGMNHGDRSNAAEVMTLAAACLRLDRGCSPHAQIGQGTFSSDLLGAWNEQTSHAISVQIVQAADFKHL